MVAPLPIASSACGTYQRLKKGKTHKTERRREKETPMSVDPSSRNQLDSRTSRKSPTKINKKNTKVFQENEKKNGDSSGNDVTATSNNTCGRDGDEKGNPKTTTYVSQMAKTQSAAASSSSFFF